MVHGGPWFQTTRLNNAYEIYDGLATSNSFIFSIVSSLIISSLVHFLLPLLWMSFLSHFYFDVAIFQLLYEILNSWDRVIRDNSWDRNWQFLNSINWIEPTKKFIVHFSLKVYDSKHFITLILSGMSLKVYCKTLKSLPFLLYTNNSKSINHH